jgi:hypothetical protein
MACRHELKENGCNHLQTHQQTKFKPKKNLTFFGEFLPWSNKVKYLGVTLDAALNFTSHIAERIHKASGMKGCLSAILNSRKVSLSCKRRIYTAMLRPTLLYASQIWMTTCPSNLRKLEQFQAKTLRKIASAPTYVRNSIIQADLKIEPIQDYIIRMANRFYSDPQKSGNRPLMDALEYDETVHQDHKWRPRQLLYRKEQDSIQNSEDI